MAKQLFSAEGGFRIDENGVAYITGTGEPDNAYSNLAPKGSVYTADDTGHVYRKHTVGTGTDKWRRLLDTEDIADLSGALLFYFRNGDLSKIALTRNSGLPFTFRDGSSDPIDLVSV